MRIFCMMRKKLELLLPPPVVAIVAAILSYLVYKTGWGNFQLAEAKNAIASIFWLFAALLGMFGIKQFRKSKTTIHPEKPENTIVLVTTGVYRWSRNPMYLGLALGLVGWCFFLQNFLALIGPLFLISYLTRFQIQPEEKILKKKFGEKYQKYIETTRRWL